MLTKTYKNELMEVKERKDTFIDRLEKNGLLKAGSLINKNTIEAVLDCKYEKDNWVFLGKYLTLKTQIESRGFFITQRDLEMPSFRILNTEEMAEEATRKLSKALATNYKVSYIMAAHDSSSLDEKNKKIYKNVQQKAANIAMAQQKILLDEFYFD